MFRGVVHAFVLVALVGCPRSGVDQGTADAGIATCAQTCDHVAACEGATALEIESFMPRCLADCEAATARGDVAILDCVRGAQCDDLAACYGATEGQACATACDRINACSGDAGPVMACSCEAYTASELECLAQATCDDLEACLANEVRDACRAACNHVATCQGVVTLEGCVEHCVAEDNETQRNCLTNAACNELDACLDEEASPCEDRCLTLLVCQQIERADWQGCVSNCADWNSTYSTCVDQANCSNLLDTCGATP